MKVLLIFAVGLMLSIPSGILQQVLPLSAAGDELPFEQTSKDSSDSIELLKLIDVLLLFSYPLEAVGPSTETFVVLTSPAILVAPPDRESHFCRPPPAALRFSA